MNLIILPNKVLLAGHDLLQLRESKHFLACFGTPSRHRDITMHPSGTRVAMVWDELGLVAYGDRNEGLMSHFLLAFDPGNTPERPTHASQACIEINGGTVTVETSERTLPRTGATPVVADFGKHFFYKTDACRIDFIFKRQANPNGRRVLTKNLVSISFAWL